MDARTEKLLSSVHEAPQDVARLQEAREHLLAQGNHAVLTRLLEWWAEYGAPTQAQAAEALCEASRHAIQDGAAPVQVKALLDAALNHQPDHALALEQLARWFSTQNQPTQAADTYLKLARRSAPAAASTALEAALAQAPGHEQALDALEALSTDSDEGDARMLPFWTAFVEAAPDGPGSRTRRIKMVNALTRNGRLEDAARHCRVLANTGDGEAQRVLEKLERSLGRGSAGATKAPSASTPDTGSGRSAFLDQMAGRDAPESPQAGGPGSAATKGEEEEDYATQIARAPNFVEDLLDLGEDEEPTTIAMAPDELRPAADRPKMAGPQESAPAGSRDSEGPTAPIPAVRNAPSGGDALSTGDALGNRLSAALAAETQGRTSVTDRTGQGQRGPAGPPPPPSRSGPPQTSKAPTGRTAPPSGRPISAPPPLPEVMPAALDMPGGEAEAIDEVATVVASIPAELAARASGTPGEARNVAPSPPEGEVHTGGRSASPAANPEPTELVRAAPDVSKTEESREALLQADPGLDMRTPTEQDAGPPPDGFEAQLHDPTAEQPVVPGRSDARFPTARILSASTPSEKSPDSPEGTRAHTPRLVTEVQRLRGSHLLESVRVRGLRGRLVGARSRRGGLRVRHSGNGARIRLVSAGKARGEETGIAGWIQRGEAKLSLADAAAQGKTIRLGCGDRAQIEEDGLTYRVEVRAVPDGKLSTLSGSSPSRRQRSRLYALLAAIAVGVHALALSSLFLLDRYGVELIVDDRPQKEIFAEIKTRPEKVKPRPPRKRRPRPPKKRELKPPSERQAQLPKALRKRLREIDKDRSRDRKERLLSALTSPVAGDAQQLQDVVTNLDAVKPTGPTSSFRVGGTLAAIGGDGVRIATSGGGDLGTLGGQQAAKNTGRIKARKSGKTRGKVRAMRVGSRVSGGLTRQQVGAVINKQLGKVQRCYERALTRNGSVSGRISYGWTIKPNGRVRDLREASSTIGDRQLSGCIRNALKTMRFPRARPPAPTPVVYPFIFRKVE